jgi:prepilin-type N-terminal cleavage/methylation domain-containing protein
VIKLKSQSNKIKAFTLIELMAVVIILGIITTITVTSINYSIKRSRDRLYVQQVQRLTEGVRKWAIKNTETLPNDESGIVFFSVSRLKDEGIVDTEIVIDPRTNQELVGCMTIRYDEDYQQYSYEYEDMDCAFVSSSYMPIINVNGGDSQFVEVNGVFNFPLVTAADYNGRSIRAVGPIIYDLDDNVLTSIDKSIVGTRYRLEYKATDDLLNLTQIRNIELTVQDTIPPVITCGGRTTSHSMNFEADSAFTFPTCIVSDNSCGTTGVETNVNSCTSTLTPVINTNITPNIPGTYNLEYSATDSSANTRFLIITVNVEDTTAPTQPTFEYRLNTSTGSIYNGEYTNQDVWIGNFQATDLGIGIMKYQYATGASCDAPTPAWSDIPGGNNYILVDSSVDTQYCISALDFANNRSEKSISRVVRIDKSNPTITSITGNPTTWTNQNVTLTINANDTGSNLHATPYSFNGGTSWQAGNTSTFSSNQTVSIRVRDSAGNITSSSVVINRIDIEPPVCTSSGGSTAWTNGNRTLTGACTDTGGSGCVGNVTNTYSTNTNITNASPGTVTDNAGNSTVCPANQTVRIDKTAPTCASSGGNATWTNGNRTLTGTCTDTGGSGCSSPTITNTFTTDTNTTTATPGTVTDLAGNSTACPANQTVRIDKTAPTCASSGGSTAWTNGNRTITGTCTDLGGSGCSNISYTFTTDTNITTAGPGASGGAGTVTDGAGNTGSCPANQTVRIDKIAPTCASSGGDAAWTNGNRTLTGTCTDLGGSGCSNISNTFTTNTNTTTASPGTVTDGAGNTGSCPANQTVRIDKTAPSVPTVNLNGYTSGNWTNGDVTTTLGSTDTGGSGLSRYQYSHDNVGWADWPTGTNPWPITWEGNWSFYTRAVDVAGNVSGSSAVYYIRIDKTAPSLSYSRNGSTTYSTSQCTTPSYSDTGGSGINGTSALYVWSSATSGVTPSYAMPQSSRCYSSTTTTVRLHGRVCDNAGNCTQNFTNVFYVDVEAPSWVASPTHPTCVRYTTIAPCGFTYMYRLTNLNRLATESRTSLRAVRVTFGGSSSTSTSFGTWHTSNTYITTSGTISRVWAEDTLLNRSGTGTNITGVSCSSGGSTSVCSN